MKHMKHAFRIFKKFWSICSGYSRKKCFLATDAGHSSTYPLTTTSQQKTPKHSSMSIHYKYLKNNYYKIDKEMRPILPLKIKFHTALSFIIYLPQIYRLYNIFFNKLSSSKNVFMNKCLHQPSTRLIILILTE